MRTAVVVFVVLYFQVDSILVNKRIKFKYTGEVQIRYQQHTWNVNKKQLAGKLNSLINICSSRVQCSFPVYLLIYYSKEASNSFNYVLNYGDFSSALAPSFSSATADGPAVDFVNFSH
jgi:hypothetical protein